MDKTTFTALAMKGENSYYRVAKSILQREQDVEDAVQEGLFKAYQKRNTLKDVAFFQTWLTRIIINECYTILRKAKDTGSLEDEGENLPAKEEERYTELYEAIRMLPPKVRIVIVLYYVEGYSTAEIKSILKIPQGTVKSRLSKGRELLKNFLEYEGERNGSKTMAKSLS